jgi:hypothetical protein
MILIRSSGWRFVSQRGKDFLGSFARDPEVKRIRAKVDLIRPHEFTHLANPDTLERVEIAPKGENSAPDHVVEVDLAMHAVVERQIEPIAV